MNIPGKHLFRRTARARALRLTDMLEDAQRELPSAVPTILEKQGAPSWTKSFRATEKRHGGWWRVQARPVGR